LSIERRWPRILAYWAENIAVKIYVSMEGRLELNVAKPRKGKAGSPVIGRAFGFREG
jgi:hypothetical protein